MRFLVALAAAAVTVGFMDSGETWGVQEANVVDEGRFLVSLDGRPAGSEAFSIRRSGSGPDARTIAQAQIELEGRDGTILLAPALEGEGEPVAVSAYQIKVSGARQEELYVTLADRRFITRVRSEAGEQEREYRAAPGTVLLDRDVAHHFHFPAARVQGEEGRTTLPVIRPRDGRQHQLTVEARERETISLGGRQVDAVRLHMEGGGETHRVWVDDRSRVLRVESPASNYLAVRDQPPGDG